MSTAALFGCPLTVYRLPSYRLHVHCTSRLRVDLRATACERGPASEGLPAALTDARQAAGGGALLRCFVASSRRVASRSSRPVSGRQMRSDPLAQPLRECSFAALGG